MSTQEEQLESVFKKMALSLHRAIEADAMWREFGSEENYKEHQSAIYEHRAFFESIIDLSRFQAISGLGRFTDRSSSGMSFPELLKRLKKSNYDQAVVKKLSEQYAENEHIWKKIKVLRGGVVAHTSRTESEVALFKKAGITNDEVSMAIATAKNLLAQVSVLLGVENSLISKPVIPVKSDCRRILSAISAVEQV